MAIPNGYNLASNGYYYRTDGSGPYSISPTGVATLVGAGIGLGVDVESVQDIAGPMIQGTGIATAVYNDSAGTVSVDVPVEAIDDRVAALLVAGNGISLSYNDAANTLTIANAAPDTGVPPSGEDIDDRVAALLTAGTGISLTYNDASNSLTITNTIPGGGGGGGLTLEEVDDRVAQLLVAGTNVTLTYDDAANTLTIAAPVAGGGLTLEDVDDRVAALLVAGTNVTLTYNDAANTLTIAAAGGGGTTLTVQNNDVTVNVANVLDFSSEFAVTESPAGEANVAIGTGIARILDPVIENGTAFSIANITHTEREVIATNAAAVSATFSFAGMVANKSAGVIYQAGAGTVTLLGATFAYAPGVTALATTAGQNGWISWRYLGGTTVLIDARAQVVSGGGGGGSNPPASITANTTLNAAAHANRQLNIAGGYWILTVDTDANAGWQPGDQIRAIISDVNNGGFFLAAAGGVTIRETPTGSRQSDTSATRSVILERVAANTWQSISVIDSVALRGGNAVNASFELDAAAAGRRTTKTDSNPYTWTIPPSGSFNAISGTWFGTANGGPAGNVTVARGSGVTLWVNGTNQDLILTPGQTARVYKAFDGQDIWFAERG
jgi:hypothetical protein